jgi:hypothetical protein
MTNEFTPWARDDDEDTTGRLLRLAGPRPVVPDDRADRVRAAVHAHWASGVRRRRVRRWTLGSAVLTAAAALLVFVARFSEPPVPAPVALGDAVARVERIEGQAPFTPGAAVRERAWIETGDGRVGLELSVGASFRVDRHTRARLLTPTVVELAAGTVYLDNDEASGLEVRTPFGTAHDVGTQFEVHVDAKGLRLRVRTGRVALDAGSGSEIADAGTELTWIGGALERSSVRADGPEWEWAARLGPVFSIEGRSLAAFIAHLSREQGWQVRYRDPGLQHEAAAIILHGSVDGLSPHDAVAVTTTTSGLDFSLEDGTLVVFKPPRSR